MKSYLSYIDSEIRWIGKIPKHWKVSRIKYTDLVVMGQSPKSEDYNQEGIGLPFLQGNADFTCLHPIPRVWCDNATKTAEKGDLLLSVRAPIGAVNIADQSYGIGRGLCAIKAEGTIPRFLYYCLLSMNEEFICNGTGSTFTAISSEDVRESFIPCIPASEQRYIADYLDRKTAQIDALIAKKQHQIELLQEQRTAIITQAVTKGLDLSVPMKDSSVDWLGDIPEAWEVKRLKDVAIVNREALTAMTDGELEIHYIDISSVDNTGMINEPEIVKFKDAPSRARRIIRNGDIIVSTVRTYLKSIAFIQSDEENLIASTGFATLSARSEILPEFLFRLVSSHPFVEMVTSKSVGVGYPAISSFALSGIPVWLPPSLEEQSEISEYLRINTTFIDSQVKAVQKQIDLSQEYRTAVISEAVTGKIDVRGGT